jgi:hypothetical protein
MRSSRADVIAELVALGLDAAPQHVCGSVRAKARTLACSCGRGLKPR